MEIATSLLSHQHLSLTDTLQISSLISPVNAVAPPPVKSRHVTARRPVLKRRRRTRRRRSPPSDDEAGIPFLGGDDGGFFGGGNWNFGGGSNGSDDDWFSSFNNGDDSNNNNAEDPAFDFVFEVVCWIVFSNCLHFAFKKVVRLVSEDREKVPLRIASVCLD